MALGRPNRKAGFFNGGEAKICSLSFVTPDLIRGPGFAAEMDAGSSPAGRKQAYKYFFVTNFDPSGSRNPTPIDARIASLSALATG